MNIYFIYGGLLTIILAIIFPLIFKKNYWNIATVIYRMYMLFVIKNTNNNWLTGLLLVGYGLNFIFYLWNCRKKMSMDGANCNHVCNRQRVVYFMGVVGYGIQAACYLYYIIIYNKFFGFLG